MKLEEEKQMSSYKMTVQSRDKVGSNKVNKLRNEHLIPGVIYKQGEETRNVQIDEKDFLQVFRKAGTTSVIDLTFDGETHSVIVKDLQKHPVRNEVLHIDFQELDMNVKISVNVPVNLINRNEIRLQPSVLTQLLNEVEVECLPGNIPNTADLDVKDMDFVTPLLVSDFDIAKDENIEILMDYDTVVCTLSEPEEEEEEELDEELDEDVDAGDVPVIGEDDEEEQEE